MQKIKAYRKTYSWLGFELTTLRLLAKTEKIVPYFKLGWRKSGSNSQPFSQQPSALAIVLWWLMYRADDSVWINKQTINGYFLAQNLPTVSKRAWLDRFKAFFHPSYVIAACSWLKERMNEILWSLSMFSKICTITYECFLTSCHFFWFKVAVWRVLLFSFAYANYLIITFSTMI